MTKLLKHRPKTFWTHATLQKVGDVWQRQETQSLEGELNSWLDAMGVAPVFISPPQISTIGVDSAGAIQLAIGVSILYLAEEEVHEPATEVDRLETGGLGNIFRQLQQQVEKHAPGADLRKMVRVIGPQDPPIPGEGEEPAADDADSSGA